MRNIHSTRINLVFPVELKKWLFADGSLTQQLMQLADGQFHVELLKENYQKMTVKDATWLAMPHHHLAWVREVYLYGCEDRPWVRAKSIFPILSLQAKARIFPHIGQKPIGALLFQRTTPKCERRVVKLKDGWTRQSCYHWHGCKFIVQETFLSDFEQYLKR